MTAEERVRDVLLDTTKNIPCETLQDLVFAVGLIITDHAFNMTNRLRVW